MAHHSSSGRFAWLLGTAAPGGPPASPSEVSDACRFALDCWQVLPAIVSPLLRWAGAASTADPWIRRVLDRGTSLRVLGELQLKLGRRLFARFERERIPYVLLKGSAIRFAAYESPLLRVGKDLDIGVPRSHIRRAEDIAIAEGFLPSQWIEKTKRFTIPDRALRSAVEAEHYELGFLVRRQAVIDLEPEDEAAIRRDLPSQFIWHETGDGRIACYVSVDLHHGLSLEAPVEPLVQTAQQHAVGDDSVPIPVFEWLLFHVIYKIYWEGVHNYRKGSYQYADLARLLPLADAATFGRLIELLEKSSLQVAGYYVLRRLATELKMDLRAEVRSFLDSAWEAPGGQDPMKLNDLGDMWPKLWGHR